MLRLTFPADRVLVTTMRALTTQTIDHRVKGTLHLDLPVDRVREAILRKMPLPPRMSRIRPRVTARGQGQNIVEYMPTTPRPTMVCLI